MIFKNYFLRSDFEVVWRTLKTYYDEPESLRNRYKSLYYTIRSLPVDAEHSAIPLKIEFDFENMIHIAGAPDPAEWLVGREVIIDMEDLLIHRPCDDSPLPDVSEFAAHLLYWATLYDYRTQTRRHKDFRNYLSNYGAPGENNSPKYRCSCRDKDLSDKRKRCYYWKSAGAEDSAFDWGYILDFLRKRIEFHIGYHRLADTFVTTRHYVSRMELCCRLLELAADYATDIEDVHVNTRNALRFVGPIFTRYDYEWIGENDDDVYLWNLRRAKAYKILWRFLDHNLTNWWD